MRRTKTPHTSPSFLPRNFSFPKLSSLVLVDKNLYAEEAPVVSFSPECFDELGDKEKMYAHHFGKACWAGVRIVLSQNSREAPTIFDLLLSVFSAAPVEELKSRALASGVTEEHWEWFLQYSAAVFGNLGNYRNYGDSKFVPKLSEPTFRLIVKASGSARALELMNQCAAAMYDTSPEVLTFALPPAGTSAYYDKNITKEDIEATQRFLVDQQLEAWNTRLQYTPLDAPAAPAGGQPTSLLPLTVLVASVEQKEPLVSQFEDREFRVVFGDHCEELRNVVKHLEDALPYAANENQTEMIKNLIQYFMTGNVDCHKESSKYWVRDKGPDVETTLGFIHTDRDPAGTRAEFEGYVAVVDHAESVRFKNLVDNAVALLKLLPWPDEFDLLENFTKPDFSSLQVIMWCTSGPCLGINLPNYDDVRLSDGYKNVDLSNIDHAPARGVNFKFIPDEDQALFARMYRPSDGMLTGLHELIGHGSGKLLMETEDGLNFSPDTINPLDGKPVSSWYKLGENFGSVFGDFSSAWEECRAECVSLYLSLEEMSLRTFGFTDPAVVDECLYVCWLGMAMLGFQGLQMYDRVAEAWGQAHSRARFALLRVLLDAGQGLLRIDADHAKQTATLVLDRTLIRTVGKAAIGDFLVKLNVLKATANVDEARRLFESLTEVSGEWERLHAISVAHRFPRNLFVQPHTVLVDGEVQLVDFPATKEGLIQSFVSRFT